MPVDRPIAGGIARQVDVARRACDAAFCRHRGSTLARPGSGSRAAAGGSASLSIVAWLDIENLIDDLERSYTEVQERMSDPSVYNDHREAAEVGRRLKELEAPTSSRRSGGRCGTTSTRRAPIPS